MIIITGMHRTGTSAIANMLYELGLDFGDPSEFITADRWNVEGYFENKEVTFLNDDIILGEFAPSRQYWTTPGQNRNLSLKIFMALSRMRYFYILLAGRKGVSKRADLKKDEIIKMANTHKNKVVKDPRFSITVGDWLKYAATDKIIYCHRHPFEVAMSLEKRDRLPLWVGYRLWHFHVAEFFKQIEGVRIVIVNFNNFFTENKKYDEVKRLYNFIERAYVEEEAERLLNSVLDKKLKHNTHEGEKIPRYVQQLQHTVSKYYETYSELKPFNNRVR